MNFDFTPEEEIFIEEIKAFIDKEKLKPNADDVFAPNREADAQTKIDSPARREFMKTLSKKGYLGMSWPKQYGGQEKDGIYDYILNEETVPSWCPFPWKKALDLLVKLLSTTDLKKLKMSSCLKFLLER